MDEILYQNYAQKYNVSRETFLQLTEYVEILKKWQRKINLISNNTLEAIWGRHIEDSLQIIKYVPRETSAIIDIGSGAGLPGIPVAIVTGLPAWLVESDRKKCSFMEEASRNCQTSNIKIICERIEKAAINANNHKITITARALAELRILLHLINILKNNNKLDICNLLLPKGQTSDKEIEEALLEWDFEYIKHNSITESNSSILEIKNLRRKQ